MRPQRPTNLVDRRITSRTDCHCSVQVYQNDVRVRRRLLTQGRVTARKGGGKRGCVGGFSNAARRRMTFYLRNVPARLRVMLTLTYPPNFPTNGRETHKHLRAMLVCLRRRGVGCVWKREYDRRGAPHYHLALTGKVDANAAREAWTRIVSAYCEKGKQGRVHLVRKRFYQLLGYLTKQTQQTEVPPAIVDAGRFWGYSNLPKVAPIVSVVGDEAKTAPLVRALRRSVQAKCTRRFRRDRGRNSYTAFGAARAAICFIERSPTPVSENKPGAVPAVSDTTATPNSTDSPVMDSPLDAAPAVSSGQAGARVVRRRSYPQATAPRSCVRRLQVRWRLKPCARSPNSQGRHYTSW